MVKRKKNAIGQFITSASAHIGSTRGLSQENLFQKIITVFMALLFVFIISPWLILAIKSKKRKISFLHFCNFTANIPQVKMNSIKVFAIKKR